MRPRAVAWSAGLWVFLHCCASFAQDQSSAAPTEKPADAASSITPPRASEQGPLVYVYMDPRDSDLLIARYTHRITSPGKNGRRVAVGFGGVRVCQAPCGYPVPAEVPLFIQSETDTSMSQSKIFRLPANSGPLQLRVRRGYHAMQLWSLITGVGTFAATIGGIATLGSYLFDPPDQRASAASPAAAFGVAAGLSILCFSLAYASPTRVYITGAGKRLAANLGAGAGSDQPAAAGLRF